MYRPSRIWPINNQTTVGSIEVPFRFLATPRDPADIPDHIDGKQLWSLADKRRACYDDSIPLLAINEKNMVHCRLSHFPDFSSRPKVSKEKDNRYRPDGGREIYGLEACGADDPRKNMEIYGDEPLIPPDILV
jgi:hypothetical protein